MLVLYQLLFGLFVPFNYLFVFVCLFDFLGAVSVEMIFSGFVFLACVGRDV
jgi:hypothetical protein